MQNILLAIHAIIAVVLVGVVLMQRSEGGALGIGGGGSGGGFMSARGKANFLTRLTSGLAVAFITSSLILAMIAGDSRQSESIFDRVDSETPLPIQNNESNPTEDSAIPTGN